MLSNTKEYKLWKYMERRCKLYGSTMSEEFVELKSFSKWARLQPNFRRSSFDLDKDLIVLGNKEYNSLACSFVPHRINTLLDTGRKSRGLWPVGVRKRPDGLFDARIRCNEQRLSLGCFKTPEAAFNAYKHAKEKYIKEVANIFKSDIDPRVYNTLMAYSVSITD